MLELNKNLLINGVKYYAARRPSGTVTPTTSYQYLTVDRFCQKYTGTITTPTVEAATDFPNTKAPWCSKYTGTTAAGSSISEQQRIEADFGLELIGDYISFLGFVTSTSYQTVTINIGYATLKDNHAAQTLLFTKAFTIAVDGSVQTLSWPKIASLTSLISTGLYVEIVLSNPSNTSTSSTHRIGGMSLVRGRYCPTETILAARSLQDELRYCQRYYEKSYDMLTAIGTATTTGMVAPTLTGQTASITIAGSVSFIVRKRATPLTTCFNPIGGTNSWFFWTGSSGYAVPTIVSAEASFTVAHNAINSSGRTQAVGSGGHFTATAEL